MLKDAIKKEQQRWMAACVRGDVHKMVTVNARMRALEDTARTLEAAREAIGHLVGRGA